jgi:Sec-independent protein translocase protein TatA
MPVLAFIFAPEQIVIVLVVILLLCPGRLRTISRSLGETLGIVRKTIDGD